MVKKSPAIIWNKRASIYFRKAYEYIKEESLVNAEKVREGILKIIDDLPSHPEKYPLDKLRKTILEISVLLKNTHIESPTSILSKRLEFYGYAM